MPLCTLWSGLESTMLDKYVKDSGSIWASDIESVPKHIIGCTIGTHAGPGAFGVAYFAKN